MPAPSKKDGLIRGIEDWVLPSIGYFIGIISASLFFGPQEAGIIYVLLISFDVITTYEKSKYWNSNYTLGFLPNGIFWIAVPSIIPQYIPAQYAGAGRLIVVIFFILMFDRLFEKV